MFKPCICALPVFFAAAALGQQPADTLRSTSTLVLVPTLVTTPNEELVHGLHAEDFALTDNSAPQKLHVEEGSREPLAVVVLLQTGGSAPRQFENYKGIGAMLEYALGSVPYRVSLVTFDSKPEDRWPFSANAANLKAAFERPTPGDGSAATLDAIEYGLDWFDDQHPRGQRLLLLIGDEHFRQKSEQAQKIVRRLAESNTAIYSLTYSAEERWFKDQFSHRRKANGGFAWSPRPYDLKGPLLNALGAMRENAAAEVAALSGGSYMPFADRQSLEQQLTHFANALGNRYLLSFQPASTSAGLHSIQVGVPQHPEFHIAARNSYWHTADGDNR
jgi:VWFA-related protein